MKQNINYKPPTNNTTEIAKLEQINQTGNTNMDHTHQNPQTTQTEQIVQKSSKDGPTVSETGGKIEKIEVVT